MKGEMRRRRETKTGMDGKKERIVVERKDGKEGEEGRGGGGDDGGGKKGQKSKQRLRVVERKKGAEDEMEMYVARAEKEGETDKRSKVGLERRKKGIGEEEKGGGEKKEDKKKKREI